MATMQITGPDLDRSEEVTREVCFDDELFDLVTDFSWHLHPADTTWYAQTKIPARYSEWFPNHRQITMHQVVMHGRGRGRIGHLDGNGLNNRRANLRIMTQGMILAKRRPASHKGGKKTATGYKGVCWDKHYNKWVARFRGKNLGRFTTALEAAVAFDAAARDYWGELAYQNIPPQLAERLPDMKDPAWAVAFGQNVRRARRHTALTQQEVADLVGCSRSNIAQIERGKQDAPLHLGLAIAETLGVKIDALIPTPAPADPSSSSVRRPSPSP